MTTVDDRCRLFFRHVFDDFEFLDFSEKGYWARWFGKHFRSSEGVWQGIWGLQGGSGRQVGGSWRCPVGSGEHLGRVLGGLEAILEGILRQDEL